MVNLKVGRHYFFCHGCMDRRVNNHTEGWTIVLESLPNYSDTHYDFSIVAKDGSLMSGHGWSNVAAIHEFAVSDILRKRIQELREA